MSIDDSISRLAGIVVLAGLSLAMIKQIYPDKYEQERRRRAKRKVVKQKPKTTTKKKNVTKKTSRKR